MIAESRLDLLQTEHLDWLKEIDTYKVQLQSMQKQLERVMLIKKNSREVLARVEQFQNQFIRQREVIDELRHEIKAHENDIESMETDRPSLSDYQLAVDHIEQRENFERFVTIFDELKESLADFLSENL